jgi:hypothetical protein
MNKESDNFSQKMTQDILYAYSIIISSLLIGISNAVRTCSQNPHCIKKGGARTKVQANRGPPAPPAPPAALAPAALAPAAPAPAALAPPAHSIWLGTFMKLANTINTSLHNAFEIVSTKMLDNALHYTVGDLGKKPLNESILERLQNNTLILAQMTRDPEVQKALSEWSEQVAVLSLQMLETAKPTIDLMTEKAIDSLKQIGTKSGRGIMNVCLNVLDALIGEIPIAGGIITLILAFMRGINSAMLAAAPGVQFNVEYLMRAFNTSLQMLQVFNSQQANVLQKTNAVKSALNKLDMPLANNIRQLDIQTFENAGRKEGQKYVQEALASGPKVLAPGPKVLAPGPKVLAPGAKVLAPGPASAKVLASGPASAKVLAPGPKGLAPGPKGLAPGPKPPAKRGGANIRKTIQSVTRRLKNTIHRFVHAKIKTRKHLS